MKQHPELTRDQLARIEATLKRIRDGLGKFDVEPSQEPAHLFCPEVRDAN
ncbi:hypothetical protein [Rhizobium sp.]